VSVHCNNENLKAVLGLVLIASSVSNAYVQGQDDYTFNAKGNLRNDLNKGIEGITYNHLNLTVEISFGSNKITYLYSADGTKVKKTVVESGSTTTTDYLGGYQYKNAVRQFFPTAEGYVKATVSGTTYNYNYIYNYIDHLGNVRLSYTKVGSNPVILEENDYYPFGLKH
jgi:hypothetical protein